MTYLVERIDAGRWQLTSPFGTNLGVYPTRSAAKTAGALLAGWRGSVEVV